MKKMNLTYKFILALAVPFLIGLVSCEEDYPQVPDDIEYAELSLSVSDTNLVLEEKFAANELQLNWTAGNNGGTDGAIEYKLALDRSGNNFASDQSWDIGVNSFSMAMTHADLNAIMLDTFDLEPQNPHDLKARITASSPSGAFDAQTATTNFRVTPYKPVSKTLYLTGSANPLGENITDALAMTPGDEPGQFTYQGDLAAGSFKFAVSKDESMTQDFYTRDPSDSALMVYNEGGTGDNLQWEISSDSRYTVTANLLEKTLSIAESTAPPFDTLWMVGNATPSGWDVENPEGMTQREEDPFIFTYEANFTPGEFKIFAGPLGDWCGEWYRPLEQGQALSITEVDQNSGCDPDYKWVITEETAGRYKVTLNTLENTIEFEKINLYLIGDGGPNGWNISDPEPMTYEDGTYIFNGELGADNPTGEFKFSKFTGDWCDGDWINSAEPAQSINNTDYIITHGCEGPDNKWKLTQGDAGTYEITINLDTEELTITRQ